MMQVDQFESVFRSALKDVYEYQKIKIKSVLIVTDMSGKAASKFRNQLQEFLGGLEGEHPLNWEVVEGKQFKTTIELLELVKEHKVDLICTYRNLHSKAWKHPHSLGEFLDVLVQQVDVPVLVMPHPDADYANDHTLQKTAHVMAITDHLSQDHGLVNYAVAFTDKAGQLDLIHIEDDKIFGRYIDSISKIPSIDTDIAKKKISEQLLKDPYDYISSCTSVLGEEGFDFDVKPFVGFGHFLSEYKKHIENHQVDLLVMNTKDESQLAMHGLAYPLAVELRQIPILMI